MARKDEYWKRHDYYLKANRLYYERHKEQVRKRVREYCRQKYKTCPEFRERLRRGVAKYFQRRKELWREGVPITSELISKSEKLVAEKILPFEGFSNILRTSFNLVRSRDFPFFDVLCEKDGVKCGVNVTLYPLCCIRRKEALTKFLNFFNMRFFICFVKPNLKSYVLLEVDRDNIPCAVYLSKKRLTKLKTLNGS